MIEKWKASSQPFKIQTKKLTEWLMEAMRKEDPDETNWDKLTELVQIFFTE